MNYSVKQLSDLTGVTPRTIRYYDEFNLLKPNKVTPAGYRVYSQKEIDLLQQILFFRELGLNLTQIKAIVHNKSFNRLKALQNHRLELLKQKAQLEKLLKNVEKSIAAEKGEGNMENKEKFEGFKHELIKQNEEQYGEEIREKYGEDTVNASNEAFANLTKEEFDEMEQLGKEILNTLKSAMQSKDPLSKEAQRCAELHQKWLRFTWPSYSAEAHKGVTQMYVDDPRFTKYYDDYAGTGAAQLLRDAVHAYLQ